MTPGASGTARPIRGGRRAVGAVPELRAEIAPPWPFALRRHGSPDGLGRFRDGVLHRVLVVGGEPVWLRAAQPSAGRVVIGARAQDREAAAEAIARLRFALGVDEDLAVFHARFRTDPLLGPVLRRTRTHRPFRRPDPWEALAWAVTEQLIRVVEAEAIQRALVARLGGRHHEARLPTMPDAATVAAASPALIESFGLHPKRALTLHRVAREVAAGRVDLRAADPEPGWSRLRSLRGVGSWTVEMLAGAGQGRHDIAPAGDLGLRKLVARLQGDMRPGARVEEDAVRAFFARYAPWSGLAASVLVAAGPLPFAQSRAA